MEYSIIQKVPLISSVEDRLHEKYNVCRWYELADKAAWLEQHGQYVRAVITAGHMGIDTDLMAALPQLGIVAIVGVGFEHVDMEQARRRGILVTNTPDVLTEDVADLAIGLMISTIRKIGVADRFVRDGLWPNGEMDLTAKVWGRRYGIVGLGRIGKAIAERLQGFKGTIAYTSRDPKDASYAYYSDVVELARNSDVLIVAMSGGAATRNLVGRAVFDALGPHGYVINVARGSVVDEPELIVALLNGRIAGAGLDVFEAEPQVPVALKTASNTILSPHVGSATVSARTAMADLMVMNLDAYFKGLPVVTPVV